MKAEVHEFWLPHHHQGFRWIAELYDDRIVVDTLCPCEEYLKLSCPPGSFDLVCQWIEGIRAHYSDDRRLLSFEGLRF